MAIRIGEATTYNTPEDYAVTPDDRQSLVQTLGGAVAIDNGAYVAGDKYSFTALFSPARIVKSGAFVNCAVLPTISFSSCIESIESTFYNNTALTDIYVDRLEGYVVGAPWGNTTATVHWRQPEAAPIPTNTPYQSFNIFLA